MTLRYLPLLIAILTLGLQEGGVAQATQAKESTFVAYPPRVQHAIDAMQAMPEIRQLIADAQRSGPIGIEIDPNPASEFEALWNGEKRVILVNPKKIRSEATLICTILFELHNASTNTHFMNLVNQARAGKINKESYVEKVERMEHKNALNTCRLIELGIARGLFPVETRWKIFYRFEEYYKLQQLMGHSPWIANSYDRLNPRGGGQYLGTVNGVITMTRQEKHDYCNYLSIKNDLESPVPNEVLKGLIQLQNEVNSLEGCFLGTTTSGCHRTSERIQLLQTVFKGNPIFENLTRTSALYAKTATHNAAESIN